MTRTLRRTPALWRLARPHATYGLWPQLAGHRLSPASSYLRLVSVQKEGQTRSLALHRGAIGGSELFDPLPGRDAQPAVRAWELTILWDCGLCLRYPAGRTPSRPRDGRPICDATHVAGRERLAADGAEPPVGALSAETGQRRTRGDRRSDIFPLGGRIRPFRRSFGGHRL